MENEALISKPTSLCGKLTQIDFFCIIFLPFMLIFVIVVTIGKNGEVNYAPEITIPSMEFRVLNITETRLSFKWDLLIRIPPRLPGHYACLEGDLKVYILYKGVTIAVSSLER